MPRQMLKTNNRANQELEVRSSNRTQTRNQNPAEIERVLRKKRSSRYMQTMKQLDAGGHVTNQEQVANLMQTISDEFEELDMNITKCMLGIVSECFLGAPYEVHTLDFTHGILEHYKRGQQLPILLEKARGIAMRGGYAFVEVYTDYCCAVSDSGSVSIIKG